MRRRFVVHGTIALLLVLSASACAGDDPATEEASAAQATTATAKAPAPPSREILSRDYDRSLFDDRSATIDNPWWPLAPGKRFVWTGSTEADGEQVPHRIVFIVTDLTKVIDGVRTLVGWDRDFSDDELVETELLFLAQDRHGNVWHFGEYTEAYEDGELVGGQTWLVGHLAGAKAGLLMKAEPRLGSPTYSEGFAPPPFFWNDWGKVWRVDQSTCVPAGCYDDVVVIDEYEPSKPGAHQLKYYARGVGNVRTGWRGEDADKEVLVLESVERLGPTELAQARAQALELETRARVYGLTPPAEQRPGAGG